jgi:hypothetical protein
VPRPPERRASRATVEVLMISLRKRGVRALDVIKNQRRIAELDKVQIHHVTNRLLNPELPSHKPWSVKNIKALVDLHEALQ